MNKETKPVGNDWCDWRGGKFHVVDGTCYDLKMKDGSIRECREAFCDDGGSNFPVRSIVAIKRSR